MRLICIMGGSKVGKSTLEKRLEKLGFKRSISYTTRGINTCGHTNETNGKEYHFVNKEQFMELVNKGIIIEHEEYCGNLYGTPRLMGATDYVAVVAISGYKALKEMYKNQVVGVLLKVDEETLKQRYIASGLIDNEELENRISKDFEMVEEIEEVADIVLDGSLNINTIAATVIDYTRNKN